MPWLWTSGASGDKKRLYGKYGLRCPWDHPEHGCPSHRPFPDARKPKMKLIERIQPRVYLYQCKYCGMKTTVSLDNTESIPEREQAQIKNPALIGGQKGYLL